MGKGYRGENNLVTEMCVHVWKQWCVLLMLLYYCFYGRCASQVEAKIGSISKTDPKFICVLKRSTKQIFDQWITRFSSNTISMQWNVNSSACFIHSQHWLPAENVPVDLERSMREESPKSRWNISELLFLTVVLQSKAISWTIVQQ